MQGSAGEKGAVCMGKHTSTCKNMFPLRNASWTQGKTRSQAAQGCRISSLPRGRECASVICGRRGLPGGDRASPHLCHGGYTCFAGPGGLGAGQGGCDFLATSQAPPCVVRWPRVAVCEHTTSRVSRGWEEGGGGRRHEGTGFWGTNPHRNSLREPTCVQGGKKKPHPAHGKTHPLVRKHTSTWENTSTSPHTEDGCPDDGGEKTPPQLFKGPSPEKRTGHSAREKHTHPGEEPHVHLKLLDV